jgi:hypothetical protein
LDRASVVALIARLAASLEDDPDTSADGEDEACYEGGIGGGSCRG